MMNVVRDLDEDTKPSKPLGSESGDVAASLSSVTMPSPTVGEEHTICRTRTYSTENHGNYAGFSLTTGDNRSGEIVEDDVDGGVIAAPPEPLGSETRTTSMEVSPAEIPPEPLMGEGGREIVNENNSSSTSSNGIAEVPAVAGDGDHGEEVEQYVESESESEYEYEDDEDAAFSGFIVQHAPLAATRSSSEEDLENVPESGNAAVAGESQAPARIRDDGSVVTGSAAEPRKKWREPSREAVTMSLRAEEEKTGSKRRLAQDLYRIMNQDHDEAGYSIAPKSEDTMDKWIIKLFKFDKDSNLAKDMLVLNFEHIELEMTFPEQYPFEPPFVRVVRPRFKRQTGFVMNGALCMELLTKDGWNPVNDIESVIVSIRSLLVVGDGRLQAAYDMSDSKYQTRLKAAQEGGGGEQESSRKRQRTSSNLQKPEAQRRVTQEDAGSYSMAEAHAAYSHLSDYHKKKGWDSSGWWARKG